MSIYASAPVSRSAGDYIDVTRWNAEIYTKLTEIDTLFNYVTGHDHSGADKGKQIALADIDGHTKAIHDALNIDADTLDGITLGGTSGDIKRIYVQAASPAGNTNAVWIDT